MQPIEPTRYITHNAYQLAYYKIGSGGPVLVLFHGFGQDHRAFNRWIEELSPHYTVYALDLFYHGKSSGPDHPLDKLTWEGVFGAFLSAEHIDRFSLAGFSLGGRFVIATLMPFHQKIEATYLTAPDGFFESPWYQFATFPMVSPLYHYLMKHPTFFDKWLALAEKSRLASHVMVRFARQELSKKENRIRAYQSWVYFKPLKYRLSEMNRQFSKIQTPIHVVLGDRDPIIPYHKVASLLRGMTHVHLHRIRARHHEMIDGALPVFRQTERFC
ncbi:MAG: alpha/beta hydrolase [Cyclobacteriaceae bacterium]|nr:alpha/beta hydrolase [Cyclobacteriaceae bacterium]